MASASRGAAGRSVIGPLAGLVAVDELFMASVAWRLWPAVSLNRTWRQTCPRPSKPGAAVLRNYRRPLSRRHSIVLHGHLRGSWGLSVRRRMLMAHVDGWARRT